MLFKGDCRSLEPLKQVEDELLTRVIIHKSPQNQNFFIKKDKNPHFPHKDYFSNPNSENFRDSKWRSLLMLLITQEILKLYSARYEVKKSSCSSEAGGFFVSREKVDENLFDFKEFYI